MSGVITLSRMRARPRVALAIDMARLARLAPPTSSPAIFDPNHRSEPDPTVVGLADLSLRLAALIDAALDEPDTATALATLRSGSEQLLGPFPPNVA
jgi:hypothetical protein